MANVMRGIGGAASGAAAGASFGPWGAAIGGGLGLLGGLLGGGGDDEAERQYQQQQDLYRELLRNYKGPENDKAYQAQLQGLGQMANGGLSDADKAALLQAYSQSNQLAQGREGAIAQNMQMRGGGVASSGQQAALQQQAAQDAAQRAQAQGMGQAGIAANRALQARQIYLQQIQNNSQAMNQYRMQAAAGLNNAYGNMANFKGAQSESGNMSLQNGLGNLADVGAYMYGAKHQAPTVQQNFAPMNIQNGGPGVGNYGVDSTGNAAYSLPPQRRQGGSY